MAKRIPDKQSTRVGRGKGYDGSAGYTEVG